MRKIRLGSTGLEVSPLSLGTMHYGLEGMDAAQASKQMEAYIEAGGNLIDTAQVYNNWVPGPYSRSEKVIGWFLRDAGMRERTYLCTKGGHPVLDGRMKPRLHPRELLDDLQKSLDNLQTDAIDLYLLHRDDPQMPADEILGFLQEQKNKGLLRHYGCSNWTLPRMKEARAAAARHHFTGFAVNQIWWSVARLTPDGIQDATLVSMTDDILSFHQETGMAVMAYSSQAKGYFSKRLNHQAIPETVKRLYENAENEALLERVDSISRQLNVRPAAIVLAWIVNHPFPAVPVVSCSSEAQLQEAMQVFDETLLDALKPLWPAQ